MHDNKTTQRIANPNFRISEYAVRGLVAAFRALTDVAAPAGKALGAGDSQVTQRLPTFA